MSNVWPFSHKSNALLVALKRTNIAYQVWSKYVDPLPPCRSRCERTYALAYAGKVLTGPCSQLCKDFNFYSVSCHTKTLWYPLSDARAQSTWTALTWFRPLSARCLIEIKSMNQRLRLYTGWAKYTLQTNGKHWRCAVILLYGLQLSHILHTFYRAAWNADAV